MQLDYENAADSSLVEQDPSLGTVCDVSLYGTCCMILMCAWVYVVRKYLYYSIGT